MKRWGHIIACGMFLFLRPMAHQDNRPPLSAQKSEQQLLELEDHWLQVEDDPVALEAILAPDFLHVVPAGIITKDEQLSFTRKHPGPGSRPGRHLEGMHVRVYGTVGIVNGIVVETGGNTLVRRTLFTDVFAYRDDKWQAVSAQELPSAEERVHSELRNESRGVSNLGTVLIAMRFGFGWNFGERKFSAVLTFDAVTPWEIDSNEQLSKGGDRRHRFCRNVKLSRVMLNLAESCGHC